MREQYDIRLSPAAVRALEVELPEALATAAWKFIDGPLHENPRRAGKPLREPVAPLHSARRGEYRVLYRILENLLLIDVVRISHRRDAHR